MTLSPQHQQSQGISEELARKNYWEQTSLSKLRSMSSSTDTTKSSRVNAKV
jgi:hypothetical protein